jgi:hypothetical protein
MGADLTAVSAALIENVNENAAKILWDDEQIDPLLGILEKRQAAKSFGRKFVQPIHYGDGSSVGFGAFADIQAKSQGSTFGSRNAYSRWEVPHATLNATAQWDRDVIHECQSETDLFDLADAEMQGRMRSARRRISIHAWGDGTGALCRISARTATTFTVPTWAVNRLSKGDDVTFAAAADTGNTRNGYAEVDQINEDTGVVTCVNITGGDLTSFSVTANDFLFYRLDAKENTANSNARVMMGFGGWVPGAAPGPTSFMSVNRQGVWQLGGLRDTTSGLAIKTKLLRMANKLFQFGGVKVTHAFLNVEDYTTLSDALDTAGKSIRIDAREFKVAFDGIAITGAMCGEIKVLAHPYAPKSECLMGDFKTPEAAYLVHPGKLINLDDHDGNVFLRATNAAAYEARMYAILNLVVGAPGRFIKGTNVGV